MMSQKNVGYLQVYLVDFLAPFNHHNRLIIMIYPRNQNTRLKGFTATCLYTPAAI